MNEFKVIWKFNYCQEIIKGTNLIDALKRRGKTILQVVEWDEVSK